jgi:hypothetical protein
MQFNIKKRIFRKIKSRYDLIKHQNQIIDYVNKSELSFPIRLHPPYKPKFQNDISTMVFSWESSSYLLTKNDDLSKFKNWFILQFKWLQFLRLKIEVSLPEFKPFEMKFQANQIQVVNTDRTEILHILLPGADSNWFLTDIKTRKKINSEIRSLISPQVIFSDASPPYFISEYIDIPKDILKQQVITPDYLIFLKPLAGYYQEIGSLEVVEFKSNYFCLLEQLHQCLAKYNPQFAQELKEKLINLFDSISFSIAEKTISLAQNIHGDLNWRENILQSENGDIYFIDWELSRRGNVLYDLFYMLLHDSDTKMAILASPLAHFFTNREFQKTLLEPFEDKLNLYLSYPDLILYFLTTLVDMLKTKTLIMSKKRIPELLDETQIQSRLTSLEHMTDFSIELINDCIFPGGSHEVRY